MITLISLDILSSTNSKKLMFFRVLLVVSAFILDLLLLPVELILLFFLWLRGCFKDD